MRKLVLAVVAGACLARGVPADDIVPPRAGEMPAEGRYVGRSVPDLRLTDSGGRPRSLSEEWKDGPVLLALVFSRCAGVCSPMLASLRSAQAALPAPPPYRTVVVSFDPRDTAADMAEWADRLGLRGRADWTFAVADGPGVRSLASAVGFWSSWDERRRQFDHPALVLAIVRGRVVRFLVGGAVAPLRLQEVVREISGELVGQYPLPGRVLVRCFQYDPARGVVIDWGFLVLMAPAGLTAATTLGLFALARGRRPARREGAG